MINKEYLEEFDPYYDDVKSRRLKKTIFLMGITGAAWLLAISFGFFYIYFTMGLDTFSKFQEFLVAHSNQPEKFNIYIYASNVRDVTNAAIVFAIMPFVIMFSVFIYNYNEKSNYFKERQRKNNLSWSERIVGAHDYTWRDLFIEFGGNDDAYGVLVRSKIVDTISGAIRGDAKNNLLNILGEYGGLEKFIEESSLKKTESESMRYSMKKVNLQPLSEVDLVSEITDANIGSKMARRGAFFLLEEVTGGLLDVGTLGLASAAIQAPKLIKAKRRTYILMTKVFKDDEDKARERANFEFVCDVVMPTTGKVIGGAAGAAAGGAIASTLFDKGSQAAGAAGAAGGVAGAAGAGGLLIAAAPYLLVAGGAIAGGLLLGGLFRSWGKKMKLKHFKRIEEEFHMAAEMFYKEQVTILKENISNGSSDKGLIKMLELHYEALIGVLDEQKENMQKNITYFQNILGKNIGYHPAYKIIEQEYIFSAKNHSNINSQLKKLTSRFHGNLSTGSINKQIALDLYAESYKIQNYRKNSSTFNNVRQAEKNYVAELRLLQSKYGDELFEKAA